MKRKLHPVRTQTGEYIPAAATNIALTFARERKRLAEEEAKKEKPDTRNFSEIFDARNAQA
jgi:hypothetical protein